MALFTYVYDAVLTSSNERYVSYHVICFFCLHIYSISVLDKLVFPIGFPQKRFPSPFPNYPAFVTNSSSYFCSIYGIK